MLSWNYKFYNQTVCFWFCVYVSQYCIASIICNEFIKLFLLIIHIFIVVYVVYKDQKLWIFKTKQGIFKIKTRISYPFSLERLILPLSLLLPSPRSRRNFPLSGGPFGWQCGNRPRWRESILICVATGGPIRHPSHFFSSVKWAVVVRASPMIYGCYVQLYPHLPAILVTTAMSNCTHTCLPSWLRPLCPIVTELYPTLHFVPEGIPSSLRDFIVLVF